MNIYRIIGMSLTIIITYLIKDHNNTKKRNNTMSDKSKIENLCTSSIQYNDALNYNDDVNPELENLLFQNSDSIIENDEFIKWCIAIAGPMLAKNGVACTKMFSYNIEICKETLKRNWSIHNREELIETIKGLINEDKDYKSELLDIINEEDSNVIYKYLKSIGYKENYALSYSKLIPAVTKNFKLKHLPLPSRSFLAWDLARGAFLALDGNNIGYLTKEECLELIKSLGQRANEVYNGWEEYAASFLYYRRIWINDCGGFGEKADEIDSDYSAIHALIHSKKSPYKNISFFRSY